MQCVVGDLVEVNKSFLNDLEHSFCEYFADIIEVLNCSRDPS